jgi:hypothetical protein
MFATGKITPVTTALAVQVLDAKGYLLGITLNPGTDASSVTVYDNDEASGTALYKLVGAANGSSLTRLFIAPVKFNTGLHVVVTGTNAVAYIQTSV